MGEFLDIALGFPTVLFSFLLIVVVGYWIMVLIGLADVEGDAGAEGPSGGCLAGLGLGGPPAGITVSLLILLAWFTSLAGSVLLDRLGFVATTLLVLSLALLVLALLCAWLVTRLLVAPLRRLFPNGSEASRTAFVGALCVIRTGRVTADFGQAEVTAGDGSSAIIQVRQTGGDQLRAGSRALIYDYDVDGEFFWVMPTTDLTVNPEPSPYPMT
jgi:hypothetical protein